MGRLRDAQRQRFPEEVEQGYLGFSCRGKIAWMDSGELDQDAALHSNNANLSFLAQSIQPYAGDVLDGQLESRTPGLVCLTIDSTGDAELPCPEYHNWSALRSGCDTIIQVPITRWDVGVYWTENENAFEPWQSTTRHQSLCEGAEFFDNRYFEISNNEAGSAASMDPVQRLVLECGAQSMAMVGLTKKECNRKSTHAGFCVGNDKLDWMTCPKETTPSGTSTVLAIIANRFSFVFNLKGPNFVCDTACSASLTSTHCARFMISS
eukprot:Skav233862  [mRNA]  locus=scaffold1483:15660:23224:+ [translate_table: standard]